MLDIFKKKRIVIVDEKDVTKVLNIVNHHVKITHDHGLLVEHCGWEDDPSKWFVMFYSINKEWERIVEGMKQIDSVEVY